MIGKPVRTPGAQQPCPLPAPGAHWVPRSLAGVPLTLGDLVRVAIALDEWTSSAEEAA